MLKGYVFKEQVFQNEICALIFNEYLNSKDGIFGNYKDAMAVSSNESNVAIASGAAIIQGRAVGEDSTTTLDAGTDSAYCKLVIEINLDKVNTSSDFLQAAYKIIKSVNTYPELTQENIIGTNSGIYQYELARFRTNTNGITDFQDMRTYLNVNSIYGEIAQHISNIDDEKIFLPVGAGCDYYGTTLPNENYMWADGSAISRTEYSELFTKIGTTYGPGDGSTTFNLPDKRNRVSVMKGSGTFAILGDKVGEEKHTMTLKELVKHLHTVFSKAIGVDATGGGYTVPTLNSGSNIESKTNYVGEGQPFNVVQPSLVCNYIIRVK